MASGAPRQDCVRFNFLLACSSNVVLQDLNGLTHKLPLMHDALKLSVVEKTWFVKIALQVNRSCSVIVPSLKRSPEAADLEGVNLRRLTAST